MKMIIYGFMFLLMSLSLWACTDLEWLAMYKKPPKVLVLHSYDKGYQWVDNIDRGINSVFKDTEHTVKFHYMKTKQRNLGSKQNKQQAGQEAIQLIEAWQPDVILSVDDNAQNYGLAQYIKSHNVKVVFAGINNPLDKYHYIQANNVTGIKEHLDYKRLISFLNFLFAEQRYRVLHITSTALEYRARWDRFDKELNAAEFDFKGTKYAETFAQWQQHIVAAKETADILLFSHFHSIKHHPDDPHYMPPNEVMQWTHQHSNHMKLGLITFFISDGKGHVEVHTSGFEQGEKAALMAVQLVEGKPIENLPIIDNKELGINIRDKNHQIQYRNIESLELNTLYDAYAALHQQ